MTRSVEDCRETLHSLRSQTLRPEIVVTVGEPVKGLVTGEVVGRTMNEALSRIQVSDYDFLLKSDDDILYPPRFLEVNTQADYDAMGRGAGLLVRVEAYLKYIKEWDTTSLEDSYPFYALLINNRRVLINNWVLPAKLLKPSTEPSDFTRMWACGRDCYRIGFPFEVYAVSQLVLAGRCSGVRAKAAQLWAIVGYVSACVRRLEKSPIAGRWCSYQRMHYHRRILRRLS